MTYRTINQQLQSESARAHKLANQCQILMADKAELLEALETVDMYSKPVGDTEMATISFNELKKIRALIEKHRGKL